MEECKDMISFMKKVYYSHSLYIFLGTILIISGCNAPKSALNKFDTSFHSESLNSSSFTKTIQLAQAKQTKGKNPKKEDLLWSMQLGNIERLNKNYSQSNDNLDKAEEMLKYFDYQNETIDSAASIITNENIVPYVGEEYDGIMVNTYKALNFMAMGNNDLARVEFNRALDRQRRATEKFAAEISKLKKEIDKEEAKDDSSVKENVNNPEIQSLIKSRYPELSDYKAYPDFVNPFTTYIAGVFFDLVGDYSKADPLLKESYGMVRDNEYIAQDLAQTEQILDGKTELKNTVWVIFENGMGPIKEEFRIDIPLFVATDKVKYVGIALPRLVFREKAFSYLNVEAEGKNYRTQQVADMDRIIQTEFEKDFKGILTRAIISTTSKAVAQYALTKQSNSGSELASIVVAVYSFATTAADVRIWTTLPKEFQSARLNIPENRRLAITPSGGQPFQVEIPPCNNALVYVRIPFHQTKPIYDIIKF